MENAWILFCDQNVVTSDSSSHEHFEGMSDSRQSDQEVLIFQLPMLACLVGRKPWGLTRKEARSGPDRLVHPGFQKRGGVCAPSALSCLSPAARDSTPFLSRDTPLDDGVLHSVFGGLQPHCCRTVSFMAMPRQGGSQKYRCPRAGEEPKLSVGTTAMAALRPSFHIDPRTSRAAVVLLIRVSCLLPLSHPHPPQPPVSLCVASWVLFPVSSPLQISGSQ